MPRTDTKIILLVEDNPSDVDLTRMAFHKNKIDAEMHVVWDGVQAIDYLFKNDGEVPHLILLDLKLPRMDGFSVLDRIRGHERTRHIPVIILTTSNDEQTIARSYSSGANEFIHKAPSFGEFSRTISKAVKQWMEDREARAG